MGSGATGAVESDADASQCHGVEAPGSIEEPHDLLGVGSLVDDIGEAVGRQAP